MKKVFITFLFLTFVIAAFSQQVPRERVIMEIGTGTWCQYCPGAAMGADDMVANGHDVAVIEYHNGDAFTTTASNARNSYYGITGFPTCMFDGILEVGGGSATQSMYSSYLPKYNQRIVIPCDYTASIYGQNTSRNKITPIIETLVSMPLVLPPTVLGFYLLIAFSPANWFGKISNREKRQPRNRHLHPAHTLVPS